MGRSDPERDLSDFPETEQIFLQLADRGKLLLKAAVNSPSSHDRTLTRATVVAMAPNKSRLVEIFMDDSHELVHATMHEYLDSPTMDEMLQGMLKDRDPSQ